MTVLGLLSTTTVWVYLSFDLLYAIILVSFRLWCWHDEVREVEVEAENGKGDEDGLRPSHSAHAGPLQGVPHGDEPLHRERHDEPDAQETAHLGNMPSRQITLR